MTQRFAYALMNLLDVNCNVYFRKEEVPIPGFFENSSVSAIFPREGFIFIDIEEIPNKEEFYILLCNALYQMKFITSSHNVYDLAQSCNAFVYHVVKIILGIELEFEKNDEFLRALSKINEEYPESLIVQMLEEYGCVKENNLDKVLVRA